MKETFYFSHDYNARTDVKIKKLIRVHGLLGYGLYWAIIEDLYQNTNVLRTDYESISYEHRLPIDVVSSVINDFELFVVYGDKFGSASVERRLDERAIKSKKARESVSIRWDRLKAEKSKTNSDTNVLRTNYDSNTIKERKGNEMKVNESKEKKEDSPVKPAFPDFSKLESWMVEPLKIWFDYKKEKKQGYKPIGWNSLIEKIRTEYTNEAELMEAVKYSTSKNYTGLFRENKPAQQTESTAVTDDIDRYWKQ